ncbi:hypothetical protein BgiBS90_013890 [Biomphalaria glabrata]|nr:hypothetical protein BgiBS90_013890 [Biomphalaria glabrata]
MLLHNTSYTNQAYFNYMDQTYYPYYPIIPTEEYYGMVRTSSMSSINNQYTNQYPGVETPPSPPVYGCPCTSTPPQQSFLHQILTGKGYRNSTVGTKASNSQTLDNSVSRYSSSCCFGNSVKPSGYSSIQHNG